MPTLALACPATQPYGDPRWHLPLLERDANIRDIPLLSSFADLRGNEDEESDHGRTCPVMAYRLAHVHMSNKSPPFASYGIPQTPLIVHRCTR